jgi:LPXTG-motif cell wall-anchored protein
MDVISLQAQDSTQVSPPEIRETRWLLFSLIGFAGAVIVAYIQKRKKKK